MRNEFEPVALKRANKKLTSYIVCENEKQKRDKASQKEIHKVSLWQKIKRFLFLN
ncbi:hypothetical protein MNB_SV-3-1201 [hydrothermal vent metagenome]|uniref:Uncharacterized protein n=1 Tax=hydrothermal vent metagenome TaxID=652676 RepID=A0A1W1CN77_9ZZZZ